jgi:hypothetical protein
MREQIKPVAWRTEDHLTDKSATTYDSAMAERWRSKGWPVHALYDAPPIITTLHENGDLIAAQATIAHQAQMIEHLRGGLTPGYIAVDMTTAAADGFRDGAASVVVELPKGRALCERMYGVKPMIAMSTESLLISVADAEKSIIAAGGRVKE